MQNNHSRDGFTLLELSIVLVIIAFLIAGISLTSSMIRSAQLREVVAQTDEYTHAVSAFQDKYQALPGDFASATQLWGHSNNDPEICKNYEIPHDMAHRTELDPRRTCDGNGDGHIGYYSDSTLTDYYEWYQAWKHLANAGLITGIYQGTSMSDTVYYVQIGTNVPAGKLSGSGYNLLYLDFPDGNAWIWPMKGHYFQFGAMTAEDGNGGTGVTAALLTPGEAEEIDKKMDDGLPGFGKVLGEKNDCATGSDATTARYDVSQTTAKCWLYFSTGL